MTESREVIKTLLFPYATTACSWYINWIQKKLNALRCIIISLTHVRTARQRTN